MKMILILLSLTTMLYAQDKLSNGNGVGNGGDAVVCKDSIEILDFAEARLMKKFTIIPQVKNLEFMELAKQRVAKLKTLDMRLFEQYTKVLGSISHRIVFIDNAQFRDIPDSFEFAIPQGCKLEQLAIQQEIDGKTMIHISKSLWDRMDSLNKAGLVLHEIIYEHLLATGEVNSIKARGLNGLIFSKSIENMNSRAFKEYLKASGIKNY